MNSLSIFWIFLRLGCVSFGGPVAHIGYFHHCFVQKLGWLDEERYQELVALCQFLPGPASSQLGMAIGYQRGGVTGSIAAWLGFTLPSALLMLAAGLWLSGGQWPTAVSGALLALKLLAVAIVIEALRNMAATACRQRITQTLAVLVAAAMLLQPGLIPQVMAMLLCALIGALWLRPASVEPSTGELEKPRYWPLALIALGLLGGPAIASFSATGELLSSFFRVGSLVFGGGHVVLPLLANEPLIADSMSPDVFLAGYSLAQGVPGPMFSLAAYLGSVLNGSIASGVLALIAIFAPAWLVLLAVLPAWQRLRVNRAARGAIAGVGAGVVGLLVAAFYSAVWSPVVLSPARLALVLIVWLMLAVWRVPLLVAVISLVLAGAGWGLAMEAGH